MTSSTGGDGDDYLNGEDGKDVIYGGDGNDMLIANDGQRDKLYCGEGKDRYLNVGDNKIDYVDSSCETASASAQPRKMGPDVVFTSSASASSVPVPPSGGLAILLPTAALLLWSSILAYAILGRR